MTTLIKSRRIGKSKNCRIKYRDPHSFDILEIRIEDGNHVYIYQIEAKNLSTQTDSIHFYPSKVNGEVKIKWVNWAAPYIRLISNKELGFFQKLKFYILHLLSIFKV